MFTYRETSCIKCAVTHFGEALTEVLRETGMSRNHLAKLSELTSPQISRYIHGETQPEFSSLSRMVAQFGDYHRAVLMAAHLRDRIPESAKHLIKIRLSGSTVLGEVQPGNKADEVSPEVQEALEFIQFRARKDPQWQNALVSLVRVFKSTIK